MGLVWNIIITALVLALGLFLAIWPEKALFMGDATKTRILVMRIIGIVILVALVVAAFCFVMAISEGQIVI